MFDRTMGFIVVGALVAVGALIYSAYSTSQRNSEAKAECTRLGGAHVSDSRGVFIACTKPDALINVNKK